MTNLEGFILVSALGSNELLAQALNFSDTLATPKESQMLFYITGVSINSKPRKDGWFQGYIVRGGVKKYLYGETPEEIAEKIKFCLKENITIEQPKKKTKRTPLFKDYVNEWAEKYKKPNLKPKSYERKPILNRLLLSTGIRIGEALALYKTDFDFIKHTVNIDNDVVFIEGKRIEQEDTKTEAGGRVLPVPEKLCKEIENLPDGLLFPFSYNAVRQSLDRLSERLGFKVTAHLLRHTFNTRLEEAGIPPKVRQYLMGHAKLDMTMNTYTDVQEHYVESSTANVRKLFDI